MSNQQLLPVNGVDLCVETLGTPADPAVLLIMGAAAPMDWWPDGFCERLASEGHLFVIRYDHRDTGQSTSFEAGAPSYTSADMTDDAIGVLDALGIDKAHLVGASMGGGIAQELAVDQFDRVLSLTLISTSPIGLGRDDLPPMSDELRQTFHDPVPQPDWSDRSAVVEYMLKDLRPYHGSVTMDEAAWRSLVERIVDRTTNVAASMINHWILEDGNASQARTDQIAVPTLVLHGTEDPLFPYPHGQALADAIPGARLVPLEGVGHAELPPEVWDVAIAAIVGITST
ncbi:MAG TPA: alpha/beta hydrolase [Jiangellaceae bacterium]